MRKISQMKFGLLIVVMMGFLSTLLAQNEVPITTNSEEALQAFVQGRDYTENLNFDKANQFFDHAISLDSDFAMAYLFDAQTLGSLSVSRKNLDKALSLADKVSSGEKALIQYYVAQADGDVKKMESSLKILLTSYPNDKRVQGLAGRYFYGHSDYDAAIKHLQKALAIDKNYAPAYNMLGYSEMSKENYPAAENAFQSYITLVPDNPNPYDSYGELLLKEGKYDASIHQYENAIGNDPHFTSAYLGIATNYIYKGDAVSAMSYYQQLYDHTQDIDRKLTATYWKAVAYVHMNNIDEAIRTFKQYEQIAAVDNRENLVIQAEFAAGLLYRDTPKPERGVNLINTGMNMIQQSDLPESVKENLSFYGMANRIAVFAAMRKYDLAGYDINRCQVMLKHSQNPFQEKYFAGVMGYFEYQKNNYDKALEYYQKADFEEPLNLYYMGLIYENKGDAKSAGKMYSRAANWNENGIAYATVRNKAIMKSKSFEQSKTMSVQE